MGFPYMPMNSRDNPTALMWAHHRLVTKINPSEPPCFCKRHRAAIKNSRAKLKDHGFRREAEIRFQERGKYHTANIGWPYCCSLNMF